MPPAAKESNMSEMVGDYKAIGNSGDCGQQGSSCLAQNGAAGTKLQRLSV